MTRPTFFAVLAILAMGNVAAAELVAFDDQTGGSKAGDLYSALGVRFTTVAIPDSVAVGDIITLSNLRDGFDILPLSQAPSPSNLAAPLDRAAGSDLLMSFAPGVMSVSLELDLATTEEPQADIVRLLALDATGVADEYRVIDLVQAPDNTAATLAISRATPFSFALFQLTTEPEGFDNLRFQPVPEPSSVVMLGTAAVALAGVWGWKRRRSAA